ncbi:MAG: hybrid sensor histidine kinase/response regulator [Deltaproteobacteria bacterium]|nr:hybrid sensor histidine kinase/response regulator [Deltaproteobacteria bacterium]
MTPRTGPILYVDDEPANLTTFKYCFGERFEVLTAASGEEALRIMEGRSVALLLADQRMPRMTGAELCARARERFPDVVRMIVTAYADITAAITAINSGQVAKYILKPWREENLAQVMRAALEAYDFGVAARRAQMDILHREQEATSTFLIGQVLHELGSPLASMCANLHFLADCLRVLAIEADAGPPPGLAERVHDLDEAAREAGLAGDDLVARLQRFRAGEGGQLTNGVTSDLNRAVEIAVAIVGSELRRHAHLDLQLGPVPPVRADATQLSQIVVNLLKNAVEALEPDQPGRQRVTLRTLVRNDRVVFEVEDTGAGIPAELLPRVFEPFVTTKGDDVARGIGLAVVRDLVNRLSGDIRVSSEAGHGTCIVVELPVARP